jgi:hypothetical protein
VLAQITFSCGVRHVWSFDDSSARALLSGSERRRGNFDIHAFGCGG